MMVARAAQHPPERLGRSRTHPILPHFRHSRLRSHCTP